MRGAVTTERIAVRGGEALTETAGIPVIPLTLETLLPETVRVVPHGDVKEAEVRRAER